MRIGFFTDTFLPQRNGVVSSILSFGPELVKRGHEVIVFCPRSNVSEYEGMEIRRYPSTTFKPYPEFQVAFPSGVGKVPKLDIVHTHSPFSLGVFGLLVAKRQGAPIVSTFHTMLSEYVTYISSFWRTALNAVTWRYCRFYYNQCRAIVAPSNVLKRVLLQHKIAKPIIVLPTGIDLDLLKPVDMKKAREKIGVGGKVFLSLGRLGFEKNIDVILRAIENVDARLIIAGKGPAERNLRELARKLGVQKKVSFVGHVPEKLKNIYYSAADAFVISSTSETQAIVVAEAMACECPVIGANSLAIPEIIEDGVNGYLFDPGDSEGLSEILLNFESSKKMRTAAVKRAKTFSKQRCTNKLEKFYLSILPGS